MILQNLFDQLGDIVKNTKKIELSKLPSGGFFYPNDFELRIKKADLEDILNYENDFNPDDPVLILNLIKNIIKKNLKFKNNYKYEDIKSLDLFFLFFEIVEFTTGKKIMAKLKLNDGKIVDVEVKDNFKYFTFNDFKFEDQSVLMDGYKFSFPSIGIEDCFTYFLLEKNSKFGFESVSKLNYDFLFFCGNKNHLTNKEIENLIIIFNKELDKKEMTKVKNIINTFDDAINYKVNYDNRSYFLINSISLKDIWKNNS